MSNCKYKPEHITYVADHIVGCSYKDLTDMFNKQFELEISERAMISLAFIRGLKNGRDTKLNKGWEPTQFKKGHVPANKGTHDGGWEPTQFKKGHRPHNHRPVGSERISVDGYSEIKVAEPKKWRMKHVVIWEAANGPVPKNHVIIFGDMNKQNLTIDNLILISRQSLVRMNQNGLIKNDIELTKTGIVIADIYIKIGERKRSVSGSKKERIND